MYLPNESMTEGVHLHDMLAIQDGVNELRRQMDKVLGKTRDASIKYDNVVIAKKILRRALANQMNDRDVLRKLIFEENGDLPGGREEFVDDVTNCVAKYLDTSSSMFMRYL